MEAFNNFAAAGADRAVVSFNTTARCRERDAEVEEHKERLKVALNGDANNLIDDFENAYYYREALIAEACFKRGFLAGASAVQATDDP